MDSLVNYIQDINASTAGATSVVDSIQSWIWENFLFVALIVVGLFLTIRTRAVQWRSLPEMLRVLTDPSGHEADGRKSISSFRAFTVSAASRVGTGNIAGVAIAIAMGGPGAVFWMWVIAAVGGASAFAESLLGQLYKERGKDSYIGGPAYYMQRGLNARWLGLIFVGFIVLTYSFVFCAVQTNAIVEAGANSLNIGISGTESMGFRIVVGLFVAALTAAIIFGGIRTISTVTEFMVPFMAVLYMLLGLFVVALNVGEIPNVLLMIFQGAFGLRSGRHDGHRYLGHEARSALERGRYGYRPERGCNRNYFAPRKAGLRTGFGRIFRYDAGLLGHRVYRAFVKPNLWQ